MTDLREVLAVEMFIGGTWVSMMNDVTNVKFERGNVVDGVIDVLTPGMCTIITKGAAWSPAGNPALRRGAPIRIRGKDHLNIWRQMWVGIVISPVTTYHQKRPPITSIQAVDIFGIASDLPSRFAMQGGTLDRRLGISLVVNQGTQPLKRRLIDGIDDSSTETDVTYIGLPQNKLTQWQLISNTVSATMWASSTEAITVNARASNNSPSNSATGRPVLSDSKSDTGAFYYTALGLTHDATLFTTALTVNLLARSKSTLEGAWVYRSDNDIAAGYERREQTVDITDLGGTFNIDRYPRDAIRRRPLPAISAKSVTLNVLKDRSILAAGDVLYTPMRVKNNAAAHDRVYHVVHESFEARTGGPTETYLEVTYQLKTLPTSRTITVTREAQPS